MNSKWEKTFRNRMNDFRQRYIPKPGDIPISIKIRVVSGCFHREHSPKAYDIIDRYLYSISEDKHDLAFEEHESGPEILLYLAVTTAGLSLAKSIIELVTVILKARSDGIRQGDRPQDALELIIRRTCKNGEFVEEKVLRVGPHEPVNEAAVEKELQKAAKKLVKEKKDPVGRLPRNSRKRRK